MEQVELRPDRQYRVEVGKGRKGKYTGRFGLLTAGQASVYWRGQTAFNGYKKRLVEIDENGARKVLLRSHNGFQD